MRACVRVCVCVQWTCVCTNVLWPKVATSGQKNASKVNDQLELHLYLPSRHKWHSLTTIKNNLLTTGFLIWPPWPHNRWTDGNIWLRTWFYNLIWGKVLSMDTEESLWEIQNQIAENRKIKGKNKEFYFMRQSDERSQAYAHRDTLGWVRYGAIWKVVIMLGHRWRKAKGLTDRELGGI